MSDPSAFHNNGSNAAPVGQSVELALQRILYMILFWLLGYLAFSLSVFLGAIQLVLVLATKEKNEELRRFSRNLIQYVWECLAFVVFAREEKPFPFGKFPSVG